MGEPTRVGEETPPKGISVADINHQVGVHVGAVYVAARIGGG
jgi:hypothetical protein